MAGSIPETAGTVSRRIREYYRGKRQALERLISGMTGAQERLFDTFIFLTTFLVMAAPLYLLLNSGWDAALLRSWIAAAATALLNAVGLEATSSGSLIHAKSLVLDVSRDSTGWKSVMAFTALVVATRHSVKRTCYGILGGAALILAVNVLRVASMVYAVEVYAVDYELMHTVLWRWGLTFIVLGTWMAWLYTARLTHLTVREQVLRSIPV